MISELLTTYGQPLLQAVLLHLEYTIVSVAAGSVIGVLLGIILSRFQNLSRKIMPLLSVLQTIPGIAFIGVLFILIGMYRISVIAALAVYAMFPVLKNTYTGLLEVEEQYKEAAKGIGMNQLQSLLQVELPLAANQIFAGIRMAAVYVVSWATLAAMIGLGGLGDFVYQGTSSNNHVLILIGAIPSALLAILLSYLIDFVGKLPGRKWRKQA